VLVADDQELVRAGFCVILEAAGFTVAGEAADGAAAVAPSPSGLAALARSEERRVGMEGRVGCRSRGSACH
jgi:DNA-binding NarL/FixJ family response regulator